MSTGGKLELCLPCVLRLRDGGVRLEKVEARADKKITCAQCGRRRYGASYVLDVRRTENAGGERRA